MRPFALAISTPNISSGDLASIKYSIRLKALPWKRLSVVEKPSRSVFYPKHGHLPRILTELIGGHLLATNTPTLLLPAKTHTPHVRVHTHVRPSHSAHKLPKSQQQQQQLTSAICQLLRHPPPHAYVRSKPIPGTTSSLDATGC